MLAADEQSWDVCLDQIVFEVVAVEEVVVVVVVVVCECDCNDGDYFVCQYFAVNVVVEAETAEVEIVEVVVLVQAAVVVVVVKLAEILQIKSSLSKTTPNSCLFRCSACRGRQRELGRMTETNLELFRNLLNKF